MQLVADFCVDSQVKPAELLRNGCKGISAQAFREIVETAHALYADSLADLAEDVRRRLDGRPYLFVSGVADIGDALSIIQCLQDYEQQVGVVLAQVLQEESL